MRKAIGRLPVIGPAVIDIARSLRDPATERLVQADLAQTIREVAWLRAALREPAVHAKRLLIVSLSDMTYQLKLEAMLGVGIKLHGWRPIVLTNSRTNTRAIRYFRAFGLGDLIYLEDYLTSSVERQTADREAAKLLTGDLSFQVVKDWTFGGSWIGPQILSTVSRSRHEGAPDPADPGTRTEIAKLLPDVLLRVLVANRVISDARADLGLVIEANYAMNGPFIDRLISGGTAVIQAVQPWRDDALTFKRLTRLTRRMHPSSISAETFERILRRQWHQADETAVDAILADRYSGKWFLQTRNQPKTRTADGEAIRAQLMLDPTKKTATVFSHILWDANLFFGADLFEDYCEWFVETVRAASANTNLNWLVKLHPANLWKRARDCAEGEFSELRLIRDRLGVLPNHVKLLFPDSNISTLSLFGFSDYGVTVRGTSGMELPCFGKPTLTAGTGRYSGLGFTIDSITANEYLDRLATLEQVPPMRAEETERARRHAHAAFILRPWRMMSFVAAFDYRERGTHPLDHNLRCRAASVGELRSNGDLDRWAAWAASSDIDYIEDV